MKNCFIGMDGGGTKTAVTVADKNGTVLETLKSGGMNYNGQDSHLIEQSFADIFARLRQKGYLEHCLSMCIGAAGTSNPSVEKNITELVRGQGYAGTLYIAGDHEIALYGAHGRLDGMILIAGTGSICFGTGEDGTLLRSGGFGYLIDDEGSGYAIGRDILSAVVQASDGRLPETLLSRQVFEFLNLQTIPELIKFVYHESTGKKGIAALSILLPEACAAGDGAALAIADKCADELVKLVVPVADKLGMQAGQLALSGSVLQKDVLIQGKFKNRLQQLYPDMDCIEPKFDAAYGAVLLAQGK